MQPHLRAHRKTKSSFQTGGVPKIVRIGTKSDTRLPFGFGPNTNRYHFGCSRKVEKNVEPPMAVPSPHHSPAQPMVTGAVRLHSSATAQNLFSSYKDVCRGVERGLDGSVEIKYMYPNLSKNELHLC
jgi:hypothetical protein